MTDDPYLTIVRLITRELSGVVPGDRAAQISASVVESISREIGGQRVYLSRRAPWINPKVRDDSIRHAFNGRNIDEVMQRFRVSRRTIYRAIR